jgi:hypothetical protein
MLSTSWTVPAGFLGRGGAGVRSYGLVAIGEGNRRPTSLAPVQGIAVPAAGVVVRHRGTGLFATGMPVAQQLVAAGAQFAPIAQNDGTTLGSPSSRRPSS